MNDIPEKFYKYRSADEKSLKNLRSTIVDNKIYYSGISGFNDLFEMFPCMSLEATPEDRKRDMEELLNRFNVNDPQIRRNFCMLADLMDTGDERSKHEDALKALHHSGLQSIGTYCVTAQNSDILMWAHYADSHRGVCLEFNGTSNYMAAAQKVIYSKERPIVNYFNRDINDGMEKSLLTKSIHWAYENEWRLLAYPTSDGIKAPGLDVLPDDLITGVIFGARTDSRLIGIISSWNKKRRVPAKLYKSRISESRFELLIEPL